MPDLAADAVSRRRAIEQACTAWLQTCGFAEVRTPILESVEVFVRGVGGDTDVVRKEMYRLEDLGGRTLVLRPEGTAGVMRAAIEHGWVGGGSECKVWYLGPMFRYERPQKGRLRQFHQVGVEWLGVDSPLADAEVIAVGVGMLKAAGVTQWNVLINSLGDAADRPAFRDALVAYGRGVSADLCDDCRVRLEVNPLRLLDCKKPTCRAAMAQSPVPLDYLGAASRVHFERVCAELRAAGVEFQLAPRLVRGLDYYTRTVFEITTAGLGAQDTVLAGGRYDGLCAALGGPDVPAVGFAAGIERLEIAAEALVTPQPNPALAWIALDEFARSEGLRLAMELRALGATVWTFPGKDSLKSQMRAASARNAAFALLRGAEERSAGVVTMKNLASGKQAVCKADAAAILAAIASPSS